MVEGGSLEAAGEAERGELREGTEREADGGEVTAAEGESVGERGSVTEEGEGEGKGGDEVVKRDSMKRYKVSRAPRVLTVHLKRFRQEAHGRLNKISGHVAFGEWLDLRPYLDRRRDNSDAVTHKQPCLYRLTGIVEHSGSMRGGHYVAFVRARPAGTPDQTTTTEELPWFYISDAFSRRATLAEALKCEAYLLFYELVSAQ